MSSDARVVAAREAEDVARLFHETYERLAPSFGYETRRASAVPWEQVPERNRSLMVAVAGEVATAVRATRDAEVAALVEAANAVWRWGQEEQVEDLTGDELFDALRAAMRPFLADHQEVVD